MQRFPWVPSELRPLLDGVFEKPMPRGRGGLIYREPLAHMDQAEVDGKRHVVFHSYYLQPAVAKKAWALRDTGRYYTTFAGCCIREDLRPDLFFDQWYEAEDYAELFDLLANAAPYAVQCVIQPLVNGAIAVEAARRTGTRAVVDINDSLFYMRTDPQGPECRLETEILNRADAFVHKMPAWGVDKMRRAWDVSTPDELVHSLPVKDIFRECAGLSPGEPARLVFAGGVIPYHIATSRGHENHVMDPLIHTLAGGRTALTFLVNRNAREMFWDEHQRYRDFEKELPAFSFRKGVPFFELPDRLRENHFAIYWENVRASTYMPDHFAINMATKVFSYVEAGLPVIVHTEAPYIREYTEGNGFGLVYELDRMDEIPDLIASCDHQAMKDSLRKWREANHNGLAVAPLERAYGVS